MRIFLTLGYYDHRVIDLTPAELETLQRVLDKSLPADGRWYGDSDPIKLADPKAKDASTCYRIQLVPANHPVLVPTPAAEVEAPAT